MKIKVDSDSDPLNDVFCTRLEELHLDAYILTGSSDLADECVMEAHDNLKDAFVTSIEFANSAARLATIKSGLRKVASDIRYYALHEPQTRVVVDDVQPSVESFRLEEICRERFLDSMLQLNVFHRAVLLLRIYEQYPAYAVALLLRLPLSIIKSGLASAIASLVTSIHNEDKEAINQQYVTREVLAAVNA